MTQPAMTSKPHGQANAPPAPTAGVLQGPKKSARCLGEASVRQAHLLVKLLRLWGRRLLWGEAAALS